MASAPSILLKGFGKAKVDEFQGMVAVVLVHLGTPVAQGLGGSANASEKEETYGKTMGKP